MQETTARRLNRVNRSFYSGPASGHFSATRKAPWSGWQRVLAPLSHLAAARVLDVGCGNGRFGSYLARAKPESRYLGLDASMPLLRDARRASLPEGAELVCADLLEGGLAAVAGARFDLVVAFGLLHHLPSATWRRRLMGELAERVAVGGWLACSFWQPPALRPDRHLSAERVGVAAGEMEEGDVLLAWGNGGQFVRYVHFAERGERERLLQCTGLTLRGRFDGERTDGDQNDYAMLQRTAGC